MRVDVPDYGTYVDFPDDMDPDEITRVLSEQFPSKQAPPPPKPASPFPSGLSVFSTMPGTVESLQEAAPTAEETVGAVQRAGQAVKNFPLTVGETIGAGVRVVGDVAGDVAGKMQINPQLPEGDISHLTPEAAELPVGGENAISKVGREAAYTWKQINRAEAPEFRNELERHVYNATTSALQSLSTLPANMVVPGATLGLMGLQSGVVEYNALREQGVDENKALIGGAINGVLEAVTEKIPTGFLLKNVKGPVKDLIFGTLIREMPTELIATATQELESAWATSETWGESMAKYKANIKQALVDTAIQTPISSLLQAGGASVATRAYDRISRYKNQQEYEDFGRAIEEARARVEAERLKSKTTQQTPAAETQQEAEETGPGPAPASPAGAPPAGGVPSAPEASAQPPAVIEQQKAWDTDYDSWKDHERKYNASVLGRVKELAKKSHEGDRSAQEELLNLFHDRHGSPLLSYAGYELAPKFSFKAFMDVDDFKKYNSMYDYSGADQILRHVGERIAALSSELGLNDDNSKHGRIMGDEFSSEADDRGRLESLYRELQDSISRDIIPVTVPAGTKIVRADGTEEILDADTVFRVSGVGVSFGIGATSQEAGNAAKLDKKARFKAGLRSGSRDFDAGAAGEPAAPGKEADDRGPDRNRPAQPAAAGEERPTHEVVTPRGERYAATTKIVELDDLIASHDFLSGNKNPAYPQEMQGRSVNVRDRLPHLQSIIKNPNYDELVRTGLADAGAMTITGDRVIASGNGRWFVQGEIYRSHPEKAAQLRERVAREAEAAGMTPEQVRAMKKPVVVQELSERDMAKLIRFAEDANEQRQGGFSPTELANRDTKKITPEALQMLRPDSEGRLDASSNRAFLRWFQQNVIAPGEAKTFVTNGELNQLGMARVRNAVLAMAYGDAELLGKVAEDVDNEIRNITTALVRAAGPVLALKADISAGKAKDYWLGSDLVEAVRRMIRYRQEGLTGKKLQEKMATIDAFSESAIQNDLVAVFDEFKRSSKKLGDILLTYVSAARKMGDTSQVGMFGEEMPVTKSEILEAAIRAVEEGIDVQTSFESEAWAGEENPQDAESGEPKGPVADATPAGPGKAKPGGRTEKGRYYDVGQQGPSAYDEAAATRKRGALDTVEIARLIKKLTGEYPQLRRGTIITATSIVNGYYSPSSKKITVSEKTAEIEAFVRRVLAHELGHRIHHIGATRETMLRGNILGIIAAFDRYMKHTLPEHPGAPDDTITPEERDRFRREAEHEARAERREAKAEQEQPQGARRVTPDEIKAIWNDVAARERDPELYEYIARLSAEQKKNILREAMRGISNIEFQRQVEQNSYFDLDGKIKELYREKIKEELRKRKLYEKETITEELKNIVRTVKPFDESNPGLVAHYFKPAELYADGVSMILIDPDFAQTTAPTFYKAFFSYMENRPQVKAEYEEVLRLTEGDRKELLETFQKEVRQWSDAHELAMKAEVQRARYSFLDTVIEKLWTFYRPLSKKAARWEREGGQKLRAGSDPRVWMRRMALRNSSVYAFAAQNHEKVMNGLLDKGWSVEDISKTMHEYMLYMRAAYELESIPKVKTISVNGMPVEVEEPRPDKALPGGLTKARAAEQIDNLRRQLGAEKFGQLEQAYKDFQTLWQEDVIAAVEEAGLWSPDLLNYAKDNKYYAKFQTIKKVTDLMDVGYGGAVSTHVFRRHGSFQEVANTWTQTVLTGASLIRAAHINEVKKNIVRTLLTHEGPNVIRPAGKRWNGKFQEIDVVENENWGTVVYMRDGKPQGYYVEREIADLLNQRPEAASIYLRTFSAIMAPFKMMLVTLNPGWHISNVLLRDPMATYKNLPEASNPFRLLRAYVKTFREAARAGFHDELSPAIQGMYKRSELYAGQSWSPWEQKDLDQLDAMNARFGIGDVQYKNKVLKAVSDFHNHLHSTKIGRRVIRAMHILSPARFGKFEELWAKAAGSFLLRESVQAGERSQLEASDIVASRVGTPHLFDAGAWRSVMNNIFFFSGINISGKKSMFRSWKDSPAGYTMKTMAMNIMPAAIQYAASVGFIAGVVAAFSGDDEDDEKRKAREWWKGTGTYQRKHFINVPLGTTENGKSVALTIPMDYEGQFFHALTWSLMEGKVSGKRGVMGDLSEQMPWSLGTIWSAVYDLTLAYAYDQLPMDTYRNKPAIHPDAFEAGGMTKALELAKYEAGQMGLNWLYRFNTDDPAKVKSQVEEAFSFIGGGVFQRYIRVSDYGIREEAAEVTEEIGRKQARERWDMRNTIREDIKAQGGKPDEEAPYRLYEKLVKDGRVDPAITKPRQFAARYERQTIPGLDNARLEILERADNDARILLMERYKKELTTEQFRAIEDRAVAEGILKKGYWKKSALLEAKP